jgi:death-on-curing family protein
VKVRILFLDDILDINQKVCVVVKQKSVCLDKIKVESVLGTAFYPGDYPFQYGGIAKVAGALCYFLIKAHAFMDGNKRTAALASTLFMKLNGYDLIYSLNTKNDTTAFTDVIESAATSHATKGQLITWLV